MGDQSYLVLTSVQRERERNELIRLRDRTGWWSEGLGTPYLYYDGENIVNRITFFYYVEGTWRYT